MSGLEHRYNVSRVDGRDAPGGDREGTRYFVLDPANDKCARAALLYYATMTPSESLSSDLFHWIEGLDEEDQR